MALAFVPLYIKYLGIEAYGLIGLYALLQAWLGLLDMGMKPTMNREMARYTGGSICSESIRDLLRSAEVLSILCAILIAVGVSLSSNWLATSWLKAENFPVQVVAEAFTIMGIVTALRFVEGLYSSSLLGLQRQVAMNIISSAMATLRGVGAVCILIWVSPTIQAFFVWQGVISLMTLIMFSVFTYSALKKGERGGRFSISALQGIWRYAAGLLGTSILSLLLTQVDKVLLSKMLSLSEFGYYTLAASVAAYLFTLVAPIIQAWFPQLCQLQATSQFSALSNTYHQAAQLVSVTLGSAAIVLIVFSHTFLTLWTQNLELTIRVAPLLSLLAIGNLLNGLLRLPGHATYAYGWTTLLLYTNVLAVLIIVPAIIWATPRFGAKGAALVWVAYTSGGILIVPHFMHRRILKGEKWSWYFKDVIGPLCAATTMAIAVFWLIPNPTGIIEQVSQLMLAGTVTLASSSLAAPLLRRKIKSTAFRIFA